MRKKKPMPKRKKTPSVIQMEAVECGAASLAMILAYHGRLVPLEELRVSCGVSRDGVKASNILKAARRYGLTAKGFKTEPENLFDMAPPAIVHWNFNHFLVYEGRRGNWVFLNDPASGPRKVTVEEFDHSFTGVALTFEPGPEFQRGGVINTMTAMLRSRIRDVRSLALIILAGLMLVIPGLLTPIFSKVFIDNILIQNMTGWFRPLILGMVFMVSIQALLTWFKEYYLLRLETKLTLAESSRYLGYLLQLPMVFFSQRYSGELVNRVGNNDRVADLLTHKLTAAALDMTTVAFYALLMMFFDPLLLMVGVMIAMTNLLVLRSVASMRETMNVNLMVDTGKMFGYGATGLRLIETLKASGGENDFFAKWSGYQAKAVNTYQRLGRVNYLIAVVPPFLTNFNTVAILCLGGLRVMQGSMTLGTLVAFMALMKNFMGPFNKLVGLGADFQQAKGFMAQLDDVYQYPRDPCLREPEEEQPVSKLSGHIQIRDLAFGYNPLEPPLIEDFNLELRPGQRVALVGSSGSGKSTVAKLVTGIFQPLDGAILFDGKPREAYPRETMVNSLAVVDQNISMFEGTIRENLTLWDNTITDEQLVQAAKDAAIHEMITERPAGYDSRVEEAGANFSGGQRQRLEIARGFLNDPTILVMDEATSALDTETEMWIDDAVRRRGCTCIIVAHRLSTIRDCDEIVVMERGKIVQRGNHEQLMEQPGHYADLVKSM
ncbi:NHLP family bacteriocin export ABC transporter peptidase/permease/ATPase subunit [Acanthopleuribacter pedis]|uniref:NHLP family bacteriocin export ABC transporter peptidase/permease/ATPase subunit n=1 Tax=Acanthopleuribacter pedis TaxID=442870 RepID=A0A8J7QIY1_9BACT|nr:NHLP family bacteriocin export ABC transporter peptidase/permease/ATPase subunit [Acanthopleuribacter pedis]MBO1323235.1 NHLP family bacteriocin export ABC transporter peptidase/permease/ATPase subunit [Acanthopleuribacter pedis]